MPAPMSRVAVIGTGLIGGSLALACKSRGLADEIRGWDLRVEHAARALDRGAIDAVAASAAEAAAGCELVIVATPVRSIPAVFREIAGVLKTGAIVTDVGSIKSSVMKAAEEFLPGKVNFIGGHPMTGSELEGVEAADPDLFVNRCYILTPGLKCSPEAFALLHRMVRELGAMTLSMEAERHDRAVAVVSHLPHLLALSLMNLAMRKREETANLFYLAAGGFRDMTRIAASNPSIWMDILVENRSPLAELIEDFTDGLQGLKAMLAEGREAELRAYMYNARRGRQSLSPALEGLAPDVYTITVPVEDRPGVISEITLAIGALGINIEDLELVHPLENEKGLLRILVRGRENAEQAVAGLKARSVQAHLARAETI